MREDKGKVLLSFDVEEFDMPLEYGQQLSMADQLVMGFKGFEVVMDIVDSANIPATFFTTAHFANNYANAIRGLRPQHEIASHTFYHSNFKIEDLLNSRKALEDVSGKRVSGLRMPRMRPVDMKDVKAAGYHYDSSINPTFLPGRYNNLHLPRTLFKDKDVLRIPASVTPFLRIPLFWLSFKNLPYQFFLFLLKQTLQRDGYVCLYFHPWEFTDISAYKIPAYTKRHSGEELSRRLKRLIDDLKHGASFETMRDFLSQRASVL
jgi:peptidoglycan/xylan/chitin deacetylase (PgdA/CDA1 family)